MAAIDVHRLLDARLLELGRKCESVTVAEIFTATIDGESIRAEAPIGTPPSEIVDYFMTKVTPASADNAAEEGEEIEEEPTPEEEHEAPHRRKTKPHGRR